MTVNVLMSTYNGEHFLKEQINSILAQQGVDVKLTVRDDGSSDETTSILGEYGKKINWYVGKNLGPARSFMELLEKAEEADFYAFADQDDYWMANKLKVAADMMFADEKVPALYFSRTQLTDAFLNPTDIVQTNPLLTFGESLVYEFIPGCTMVMNRRMHDIVIKYRPDYIPMHDVWIYSVAQAVGAKIYFDKTPHILYRQHGNNTIGQGYSRWHEWNRRLKRFRNGEHSRYRRALEIKNGYAAIMKEENINMLCRFVEAKASFVKRLSLCSDKRFVCSDRQTWRLFRLAVLLNLY